MGPRLARVALVLLFFSTDAALAAAQTQPLPQLPPDEEEAAKAEQAPPPLPPSPDRTTQPATTGDRPRPWTYGLGVGAIYESNIDFLTATGPSGLAVAPRGNVGRSFWNPKAQLRFNLDGRWRGYAQHSSLNRYYATGTVSASYRSSPVLSWSAAAYFGSGHTDGVRLLAEQGVQLPLAKTRSVGASLGGNRKFGTATSLRAGISVNRTSFDDKQPAGAPLFDGQSLRGTFGLDRRLGPRNSGSLEYSVERNLSFGSAAAGNTGHYLTHFASMSWNHVLSPRSGLLLDAGASLTPNPGQAGLQRKAGFYGGASFNRKVKRSNVALFARREVTPAFGYGVSRLDDRVGLSVDMPLARAWALRANVLHVEPHASSGSFLDARSDDAALGLSRRLGRRLEASAEGAYRRYGATSQAAARASYTVGAYLTLLNP